MSTATITALNCGTMWAQRGTLIDGGGLDEIEIPIVAWLVQTAHGDVVVDAGLDPALAHSNEPLGRFTSTFRAQLAEGGSLAPRLEQHDVDPDSSLQVIVTHGHFDHVGGLRSLPNARVVVQGDEWDAATEGRGYGIAVVDHGHDIVRLDGTHDLFGDGSIVCFRTPGHTCGHQSVRVRTPGGPVIIAGDACYFEDTLDDELLPPFAHDKEAQRDSLALLQRERSSGAIIIPGHDPAVTRRFVRA